jgi:carbon starvation protein
MIQDLLGNFVPAMARTRNWAANLIATGLAVAGWGYFLYQGVSDPLGGINTLWPLFGISNQMLAAIALIMATAVLFKMKRERFAWITAAPTVWLLVCTLTAGWEKLFDSNPAIGFLSQASQYSAAAAEGKLLAPAKTAEDMHRVVQNAYVDAGLTAIFMAVVLAMVVAGARTVLKARSNPNVSSKEIGDAGLLPSKA